MHHIDDHLQKFEGARVHCLQDLQEIEKVCKWYQYFEKSFLKLEEEHERRKQHELTMQKHVEKMRSFLQNEFFKESKVRFNFNEEHYQYLPHNLRQELDDPPTKYDIYPKHLVFEAGES